MEIIDLLTRYKADIVAMLDRRKKPVEWNTEDWRALFSERAGVLEFDAGLSREDAEASAYADCIQEWLDKHPVVRASDECLHCNGRDREDDAVVPFASRHPTGGWFHAACWPAWREARDAAAAEALERLGITRPTGGTAL